jgi:hypothetical protein
VDVFAEVGFTQGPLLLKEFNKDSSTSGAYVYSINFEISL